MEKTLCFYGARSSVFAWLDLEMTVLGVHLVQLPSHFPKS